jgi:ribosome biogenesis protein ENP2
LSKDHYYEKPINSIHFYNSDSENYVISACSKSFKVWQKDSGKPFTAIESEEDICDVAWYEGSGMFFFANEGQKMKTYFIPSLGPAPKWCWFLDNLTEELEESTENVVYDDYKFVTSEELELLGLTHLIGTNYLRAYMHGFFIDMKLYREVKDIVNPFAFEEYKKDLVDKKLQSQMADRVEVKKLPKINKSLAKKDLQKGSKLLEDDRFGSLFTNPDFEVDEESEQFKLINPTVRKQESKSSEFTLYNSASDAEESEGESMVQHKKVKRKREMKLVSCESESAVYSKKNSAATTVPLGERLSENSGSLTSSTQLFGAREMKVELVSEKKPQRSKRTEEMKQHQTERRQLGRSASSLLRKQRGKFWRGRKVG